MRTTGPKITRLFEVWCVVKAHDDTGILTSELAAVLNLTIMQASGALAKLCDQGHAKRTNAHEGHGLRYRHWAVGHGPQPYHGGANSEANQEHFATIGKPQPVKVKGKVGGIEKSKSGLLTDTRLAGHHPLDAFLGIAQVRP